MDDKPCPAYHGADVLHGESGRLGGFGGGKEHLIKTLIKTLMEVRNTYKDALLHPLLGIYIPFSYM